MNNQNTNLLKDKAKELKASFIDQMKNYKIKQTIEMNLFTNQLINTNANSYVNSRKVHLSKTSKLRSYVNIIIFLNKSDKFSMLK